MGGSPLPPSNPPGTVGPAGKGGTLPFVGGGLVPPPVFPGAPFGLSDGRGE